MTSALGNNSNINLHVPFELKPTFHQAQIELEVSHG